MYLGRGEVIEDLPEISILQAICLRKPSWCLRASACKVTCGWGLGRKRFHNRNESLGETPNNTRRWKETSQKRLSKRDIKSHEGAVLGSGVDFRVARE